MIPVDEYIKLELGWCDIDQIEDNDWEANLANLNPVRTFCDGPYEELGNGCYRRLPANVGSECEDY